MKKVFLRPGENSGIIFGQMGENMTGSESEDFEDSKILREAQAQLALLQAGVVEITPMEEFVVMLKDALTQQRPLRVKCGIDPTAADVHVGHLVPYRKMRQFQDLGHTGVVIIGDYTAQIGDPTGRHESRQALSIEQVKKNAEKYLEQVYTVLDPAKTEVCYQSQWFAQASLGDAIQWAAQTTVAKLLSHETFRQRLADGQSLSLHELFYPMLQGLDSLFINADVELGGQDQKFNVLMGRDYQKQAGKRPQVAMLLPIITGLCGTKKMSKSLNNYIGVLDDPFDKFGKIMSIPDRLMLEYFQYVANVDPSELATISAGLSSGTWHPNTTKKQLAQRVVEFFHGAESASSAREKFEAIFAHGQVPEDAPTLLLTGNNLLASLMSTGLFASNGEVRRLIKQNAISVVEDGTKLADENIILDASFAHRHLRIGKRKFLKLITSN